MRPRLPLLSASGREDSERPAARRAWDPRREIRVYLQRPHPTPGPSLLSSLPGLQQSPGAENDTRVISVPGEVRRGTTPTPSYISPLFYGSLVVILISSLPVPT